MLHFQNLRLVSLSNNYLYVFSLSDLSELVFTVLFFVEMLLRIYGLGAHGYFHSAFNKYDFIVSVHCGCDQGRFPERVSNRKVGIFR